jgi:antitoxin (DNA-binding transcriptional repressor) of toxin-antitoxin stability system
MTPWLTDSEIVALTRKTQPCAQMRALDSARPPISYRIVSGRPVVQRSEIEHTPATYEPKLRLFREA